MNSQSSNTYHMDGRINGSHTNGFYGTSSLGSQRYYQPGLTPTVPVTSGISINPSYNMAYKLSPQEEIKKRLVQGHLSYLNRDETPEKLAHKTKLESLILEYLSMVPHCNKFDNIEVAECFDKSILENKNFTCPRAASAFEVLEKYATSLLTKPWRKEFRTIYPYSGYMKGLVDKQLRGASKILYLMGYRNKNVNGVVCYSAESSIIDPDTLARVSLDCLIAFVECQMMIEIADTLKRKNITLSWLQIYDIRANSICSMEQLISYALDADRLIDLETDPGFDLHSTKYGKQPHQIGQNKRLTGQVQLQNSQCHQNSCPALREPRRKNDLPSSKEFAYQPNTDSSRSRDLIHFSVDEPRSPNVIYHGIHTPTGYIAPPPMFASEFSNAISCADNHHNQHLNSSSNYSPYLQYIRHPQASSSGPYESAATNSLEKQNYADVNYKKNDFDVIDSGFSALNMKPTGLRVKNPDCRTTSTTTRAPASSSQVTIFERPNESFQLPDKSVNNLNNYQSFHGTNTIDSTSNNNNAAVDKRLDDRINAIIQSFSDEDKSKRSSPPNGEVREKKQQPEKTLDKDKKLESCSEKQKITKSHGKTHDRMNSKSYDVNNGNAWSCAYCTFLNTHQADICDMCSRSRDKPGQSEAILQSGGRVCPICTLVNSKDATRCSACEHGLQNSPTYI